MYNGPFQVHVQWLLRGLPRQVYGAYMAPQPLGIGHMDGIELLNDSQLTAQEASNVPQPHTVLVNLLIQS